MFNDVERFLSRTLTSDLFLKIYIHVLKGRKLSVMANAKVIMSTCVYWLYTLYFISYTRIITLCNSRTNKRYVNETTFVVSFYTTIFI